jgi:peptide/nickel transport system substrate-binding protein
MRTFRVSLLGVALVAACTTTDKTTSSGETGGTMVVAMPEPSNGLPPFIETGADRMVVDLLYDRLADMDTTLQTIGDKGFHGELARSWDWAPDSMSIAFHLDPRARWHDGQPVTAKDVKFSYDVFKDATVAPNVAPLITNLDSVTVRDSMTAVIWFHRRSPEQFYDGVYQVWIMPEHQLGAIPRPQLRTSEAVKHPIGSDRFKLARWETGQRIELIADTANYRGRAKLDRVIMRPITDFDAGVTQLFTGDADFFELLLPQYLPRVDSSKTVKAVPYPGFGYTFMGMNLNDPKSLKRPHPIFGDHATRLALSMAVDRKAMLQNVYGTNGKISYGPFPKSVVVADTALQLPPYDQARAKALLDSQGWKPGADGIRVKGGRRLEFGLVVPTSSRSRMTYAVLLQEAFKNVGAKVNIEQLDLNTFGQRQETRQFDAAMISYNTDPSPSGFKQTWSSSGIGKGGSNRVGYSNPKFDAMLDSSLASYDAAKAKQYASRAFQIEIDDAPGIWLYDVLNIAGAHKRLHITGLRADGWWNNLADWTIPANERIDRDRIPLNAGAR